MLAASLSAYYAQSVKMDHVKASLRTHNKHALWSEEMSRCITRLVALCVIVKRKAFIEACKRYMIMAGR
ncbi:hypothetical protein [Nitrosomonas eutropha]|uniref:hypothetical protein n=1 Tax=Nitrosomonas eutropha TaxID=916 RepID=UPI001C409081|nr:hypothetical protein [Nitrosomonas eutropha]